MIRLWLCVCGVCTMRGVCADSAVSILNPPQVFLFGSTLYLFNAIDNKNGSEYHLTEPFA